MDSKQQHGDTGREQEEADEVEPIVDVFDDFCRFGLDDLAFWDFAEEDQDGDNGTGRKVDVEAPAPAMSFGQYLSRISLKRKS